MANGDMFGQENAKLPLEPMLMIDRILNIENAGGKYGTKGKIDNIELKSSIKNFYNTCSISRTSETMATCLNNNINKIAAE